MFLLLLPLFSGCSVILAASGSGNIDIRDGIPCDVVRKQGKTAVKQVSGYAYGKYYTIEEYKIRYKAPDKSRAGLHLLLDFGTLCFWEIFGVIIEMLETTTVPVTIACQNGYVATKDLQYEYFFEQLIPTKYTEGRLKILLLPSRGYVERRVLDHFTSNLSLYASRHPNIRLIDRSLIDIIAKEHQFNMTLTDENESIELGKLVGAEYILDINVTPPTANTHFLITGRLINIETSEARIESFYMDIMQ